MDVRPGAAAEGGGGCAGGGGGRGHAPGGRLAKACLMIPVFLRRQIKLDAGAHGGRPLVTMLSLKVECWVLRTVI